MKTQYVVMKRGKKLVDTTFATYEQARQFVRRHIRKMLTPAQYNAKKGANTAAAWDGVSKGPTAFTTLGYNIKKVS